MASLPIEPKLADYTRKLGVIMTDVAGTTEIEIPADAQLVGMLDNDNTARLVFVQQGEPEGFAEAGRAYQEQITALIEEAREVGVNIYSLDDLEAFAKGELKPEVEDAPGNLTDLFGVDDDD